MNESRKARLAADYREMLKIQNRPYLKWIVTAGEPPYAEEYLLDIRIRTYTLTTQENRYTVGVIRRCTVKVRLWDSYPHIAPNIRMLSIPPAFHPSWYSKGTYCPAQPWHEEDSLKDVVLRILRTLAYQDAPDDAAAPANYKALDWFMKNRDSAAWFPSDPVALTENSEAELAALDSAAADREIIDSWAIGGS